MTGALEGYNGTWGHTNIHTHTHTHAHKRTHTDKHTHSNVLRACHLLSVVCRHNLCVWTGALSHTKLSAAYGWSSTCRASYVARSLANLAERTHDSIRHRLPVTSVW